MSFAQTKSALTNALKLPNTPVIALHGPWGSGKTYLWRETALELEKSQSITELYVSCMSYGSIASFKSAVITMLLSRAPGFAKHGEKLLKLTIGLINTKLPKELQFSANLSDFQALLPALKRFLPTNTVLVFDDIERATELDIRELLGFVSFLIDQLGTQVLLILNKEKLGARHEAWEQLREKIISIEIALQTKPDDCISIGLGKLPSTHFEAFAEKIRYLGITNIRALQHMRRTYDALTNAQSIDDAKWLQLIPSIVLFVALHFNIIDHAPNIDHVLEHLPLLDSESKELTEEQKKAHQLITDYKLGMPDAFETQILVPYLRTGYLDEKAFSDYVAFVDLRRRRQETGNALDEFYNRHYWDPEASEGSLLNLLAAFCPQLDVIEAHQITSLADIATKLGNSALADSLIQDWLVANRASISSQAMDEHHIDRRPRLNKVHPNIEAAFKARYFELYPPLSLREAINYLCHHSSWGSRQSHPIENATCEDFSNLIRTSDPEFRGDLFQLFGKYLSGRIRDPRFDAPASRFSEACKTILTKEPSSRLAAIIQRAADEMGFADKLASPNAELSSK